MTSRMAHLTFSLLVTSTTSFHGSCPSHQLLRRRSELHAAAGAAVVAEAAAARAPSLKKSHELADDAAFPPPWSRTLSLSCDAPLLYGDFYSWQRKMLTDAKQPAMPLGTIGTDDNTVASSSSNIFSSSGLGGKQVDLRPDLALKVNPEKGARVGSTVFETEAFRKVRMTYFDAGDKVQVFNSLWYPRAECGDVPVLGIDLLCFGGNKVLAVVDCQPLAGRKVGAEAPSSPSPPSVFATIRDKYPSLCGTMSNRYYDANQFFSDAMLFGRFEAPSPSADPSAAGAPPNPIMDELFPAFQEYVGAYIEVVHANLEKNKKGLEGQATVAAGVGVASVASAGEGAKGEEWVAQRQAAYDQYSAERDPAHALFKAYFGEEWADDYMHDFLFDQSDRALVAEHHANEQRKKREQAEVESAGAGRESGGGNPFAAGGGGGGGNPFAAGGGGGGGNPFAAGGGGGGGNPFAAGGGGGGGNPFA